MVWEESGSSKDGSDEGSGPDTLFADLLLSDLFLKSAVNSPL